MPRLRFTRAGAEIEAIRLATAFVATMPGAGYARCIGAVADPFAPRSTSSKHPLVWSVRFVFHPPGVVMDGGELFVAVNLETRAVTTRE